MRDRLQQAVIALQEKRMTAEEQNNAEREAEELRQRFVANRNAAERVSLPEPAPQVPPQPDLSAVLGALSTRLSAIEVALNQNRGHMPQPVSPTIAPTPQPAWPAPGVYNPAVMPNGYPWRR